MQPDWKVGNGCTLQLRLASARQLAEDWCRAVSLPHDGAHERLVIAQLPVTSSQNTTTVKEIEQLLTKGGLREINGFLQAVLLAWRRLPDTDRSERSRRMRGWFLQLRPGAEALAAYFMWNLAVVDEPSGRVLILAAAHSDNEELASAIACAAGEGHLERLASALPSLSDESLILHGDHLVPSYLRVVIAPNTSPKARRLFLQFGMPDKLAYSVYYLQLRRGLEHCAGEEIALTIERYPRNDEPCVLLCVARMEAFLNGATPIRVPLRTSNVYTSHESATYAMLLMHEWLTICHEGTAWSLPGMSMSIAATELGNWHRIETRLFWTGRLLNAWIGEWESPPSTNTFALFDSLLERTRNLFPRSYCLYHAFKDVLELESNPEMLANWLWSSESEQLPMPFVCSYLFDIHRPAVQGVVAWKLTRLNSQSHGKSRYPPETVYVVMAAILVTLRSGGSVPPLNFRLLLDCLASFVSERTTLLRVFLPFIRDTFGASLQRADTRVLQGWHRLWIAVIGRLAWRIPRAQHLFEAGLSRMLERDRTNSTEECILYMKALSQLCDVVPARGIHLLAALQIVIQRARQSRNMNEAIVYALRALHSLVNAQLMEAPKTLRFLLQQMPLLAYEQEAWPAALADTWFELLTSLLKQHPWQPTRRARRVLPVLLWLMRDRESDPRAALALSRLSYRDWYLAQWYEWERVQRSESTPVDTGQIDAEELPLLESFSRLMPNDQWSPLSLDRFHRHLSRAAPNGNAHDGQLACTETSLMDDSDAYYALARMLLHGAWAHRSRSAYVARRLRLTRALDEGTYHRKELESIREYCNALPIASPIRQTMTAVIGMVQHPRLALVSAQLMATCGATLRSGLAYESLYALCNAARDGHSSGNAARLACLLCVWLLAPASNAPEPPSTAFWNRLELDFRPFQLALQPVEEAMLECVLRRLCVLPYWIWPQEDPSASPSAGVQSQHLDDLGIIMGQSWNVLSHATWPWLANLAAGFYQCRWHSWFAGRDAERGQQMCVYERRLPVPEAAPVILQLKLPFFSATSLAEALLHLRAVGTALDEALLHADRSVWIAFLEREDAERKRNADDDDDDEVLLTTESGQRLLTYWEALWLSELAERQSWATTPTKANPGNLKGNMHARISEHWDASAATIPPEAASSDPLCRQTAEWIQQRYPSRNLRLVTLQRVLQQKHRPQGSDLVNYSRRCIALLQAAIGSQAITLSPFLPPQQSSACFRRIHTIRFLAQRELDAQLGTSTVLHDRDTQGALVLIESLCEQLRRTLLGM
jgi:hypothetical protein